MWGILCDVGLVCIRYCFVICSQWFNVLNRVHRATEMELRDMKEESANIKHAIVSQSMKHYLLVYAKGLKWL